MSKFIASILIIIALGLIINQNIINGDTDNPGNSTAQSDRQTQPHKRTGNRQIRKSKRRRSSTTRSIFGRAYVVDGDSLEINNVSIRLFGIDAPESRQYCQDQTGKDWPCGRQASAALRRFINNRTVTCLRQDTDRYGRTVARCKVGGVDLNGWVAANGYALAYRKFSRDYIDEELSAKAARRGIWRGTFTPPWQWRRDHRR